MVVPRGYDFHLTQGACPGAWLYLMGPGLSHFSHRLAWLGAWTHPRGQELRPGLSHFSSCLAVLQLIYPF